MTVAVVNIWCVRVRVAERLMDMHMRMCTVRGAFARQMGMQVVRVIVPVPVLVHQRCMAMLMLVRLTHQQQGSRHHQG